MDSKNDIIKQVRDGYNKIAGHFALTRNKFWVDGPVFAQHINAFDIVLDAACGSGRFAPFVLEKKAQYIGIDNADAIISIAQDQYAHTQATFLVGELTDLPLATEECTKTFCLAAIHHIPAALQSRVMDELYRVTQSGGTIIITSWNVHAQYYKDKFSLSSKQLAEKNLFIPWYSADGTLLMNRFVYAFEKDELIQLAKQAGLTVISAGYMNHGKQADKQTGHNIILILTKQ